MMIKKLFIFLGIILGILSVSLATFIYVKRDYTAFNVAMEDSNFNKMDELLKKGYDINTPFLGTNHLSIATTIFKDVKIEMIKYLLENGADANIPSRKGIYPIQVAVAFKRPDLVKLFISYHADTSVTLRGLTLSELASRTNQPELAACLSTQSCVSNYH